MLEISECDRSSMVPVLWVCTASPKFVTIITPSPYFDLAGWWAAGLVTDEEFVASLKYLDFSGILRTS